MPVHAWTRVDAGVFHAFHLAWIGGLVNTAFVEPIAVGDVLPKMPLFLDPERYVNVPLVPTYCAAYEGFPRFYRNILEAPA